MNDGVGYVGENAYLKRVFDLFGSLLLLTLVIPLLVPVLCLSLLLQGIPLLFFQERVGRNGKIFHIIKIRTMTQCDGPGVTAGNDPRITPWGGFLRRYRLDELPQLFQVCIGQLSFVGPRPEIGRFVDAWPERHRPLLALRPGLTDPGTLASLDEESELMEQEDVEDHYLGEVMPRKLDLSLEYFQKPSFVGDLRILWRTALALLTRWF